MHRLSSSVFGAVIGILLASSSGAAAPAPGQPSGRTRTLYVTAVDKDGAAVKDLQAADFEVKIGGKTVDVGSAQPASVPLRISVLVADQGTGAFQLGLARFMQTLLGHAEFALTSVLVQPVTVVDFSHDGAALSAGLRQLGPRGRERGAQLIEAVQEAITQVKHEARRPMILVLRLGGESPSQISGNQVREELRKSAAALYVISAAGAEGQAPSQARPGISAEQAQLADSELADSRANLALVLGDGAKDSGGRHDEIVANTHVKALERLAQELLHQYEIVCGVPEGAKAGDKISISSKKKGVTMRASSRLPE
jgi:VWFA-related protein